MLAEAPLPQKSPGENLTGLTGVRGLPINLRGDRIFGSKENFSFYTFKYRWSHICKTQKDLIGTFTES